jgi:Helix-turn-helix domain
MRADWSSLETCGTPRPGSDPVLFSVLDTHARMLLEQVPSRDEVAYLLGFAEQSSLNRAFKRWSGQTPTEYRRQTTAV